MRVCVLCIFEVRGGRVSERDIVRRQKDVFGKKNRMSTSIGRLQDGNTGCSHIKKKVKWGGKQKKSTSREVSCNV